MTPDASLSVESPPCARVPASRAGVPGDVRSLLRTLKARGCLDKQAGYYTGKILLNLALLAVSVAVLASVRSPAVQLLDAVLLGFVSVQVGMVVHDLGHHQGFRAAWKNDLLGVLHYNLLLGVSYHYWLNKHAAHHHHPNWPGKDPDIAFPFAYTGEQARGAKGARRLFVRYQAYLFLPLISLGLHSLHLRSVLFLLARRPTRRLLSELLLTPLHYALYLGLIFSVLSPGYAVAFVLTHHAVAGLYLGLVFGTNHIGMRSLDGRGPASNVYRQVATTRNIKPHPVSDYLFGPLRCQIEHHLCPGIPVNKLREAQRVVRPFCASHSIPYHEAGPVQAIREVLRHLHRVGREARRIQPEGA